MNNLTRMKLVYIKVYGIKEYDELLELLSFCKDEDDHDCLEGTVLQTVDLICEHLIPLAKIECMENAAEFHMLMKMAEQAKTEAQVGRILHAP